MENENGIYKMVADMVLNKLGPDAWKDEACPAMVVSIKCPKVIQDEIAKLAILWQANQAELESRLFSALVRDGIRLNVVQDDKQEATIM